MNDFVDVFYKMIDNPGGKLTVPVNLPARPQPPPPGRPRHLSKGQDVKEIQDDAILENVKQGNDPV